MRRVVKPRRVMSRRLIAVGAALTGLGGAGVATAATAAPKVSLTAEILYPVKARRAPDTAAGVAAKIVHYTEFSRGANILMVTATKADQEGDVTWVQVQLPGRPNGRRAWVPRDAVQIAKTPYRVRIRVKSRKLEVLKRGRVVTSVPAAVGTGGTPTPLGHWAIRDVYPAPGDLLGPAIMVLTANSTVLQTFGGRGHGEVAIHGWPDSTVLGRAVSHGCVRVSRQAVAGLAKRITGGTPVDVVNT